MYLNLLALLAPVAHYAVKLAYDVSTLSLDFNSMINIAFSIIQALWPLFVVPLGFMFGLKLIGWIMDEIRSAIPGR